MRRKSPTKITEYTDKRKQRDSGRRKYERETAVKNGRSRKTATRKSLRKY